MSNISCGIVGLPNIGKSTLFNALTNNKILVANYPFATIEPNTGVVAVPDSRLTKLQKLYSTAKLIPATITFVDIAGLVQGASEGEGLGNQFLSHIRSTNAIIHLVRAFSDNNVERTKSSHDPKSDIDIINTELVLADLQTVSKRLPRIEKEAKSNPKLKELLNELYAAKKILEDNKLLLNNLNSSTLLSNELQLITLKPMIYVFNVDEKTLTDDNQKANLTKLIQPSPSLFICAKLEHELQDLDPIDAQELLKSYGVNESGLNQLIRTSYELLHQQSYITAGPKEIRAWTITNNSTAPQAAGVIHSDFEKGFIAAQVINYNDLISLGSETAAKLAGKVRTEGRDYIMQPDDIVEFRFNVSKSGSGK